MTIGIVGLGLIGGSLALDLRSNGHSVLGVSRQVRTCEMAINLGVVDDASIHLDLLTAAELIFICTPLGAIEPTVMHLIPHISPVTILTDVGSVKAPIVQSISQIWSHYVGGHPMAGTAESGIEAAQRHLFAGKAYVLTPTAATPPVAVEKVESVVRSLKAQVYLCRPEVHDRAVAWISHLPVMVSASLISACTSETELEVLKLAQKLASSGFSDTSRVGGGNPELGVMMARYNQEALLQSLFTYRDQLNQLIDQIESQDWAALAEQLEQAQQARAHFL